MGDWKHLSLVAVLIAALVAVAALTHNGAVSTTRAVAKPPSSAPLEYLPSVDSAPFIALGHKNALADLYWIRAVLYFHNEVTHYQQFTWLQQYIDLVTHLDPDFIDIYRWAGTVMIFSKRKITFEDVMQANALIEIGAERFPNNYQLPLSAAANCSYYVKDPSPEHKRLLDACRKRFVSMAAIRPDAPQYAVTLHAQQEEEKDSPEARQRLCAFLIATYTSSTDFLVRQQIERRMKTTTFCEVTGEQMVRMRKNLEQIHERTYSFLPIGLALQVADFKRFDEQSELGLP